MKHTKKFITLAVASVMALGCVSFAACSDDNNPGGGDDTNNKGGDGGNTTVTGEAVVKDTSLQGKLFAAYTFDNGDGAATDPFTGAALSDYNVTVTDAQTFTDTNAKSGKAAVTGTGMTMPMYKGLMSSAEDGFSFSYWTWTDTAYSDWNIMVSSEYQSLTYGNLSGLCGDYPSVSQGVGPGAYSAEMWASAKAAGLTDSELSAWNSYTGYNALVYEAGDGEGTPSTSLGNEMNSTAQFMTVVVDYGSSISFYRNGALAYEYYSSNARTAAEFMCVSAYSRGEEEDEGAMTMFAGACGNVDNVIVGKSLTASDVLALYNDQMGDTKTEADAIIGSADDKAKARADQFAKDDATDAYAKALKKEANALKKTVTDDTTGAYTIFGDTKYKTGWWKERLPITPAYNADGTFDVKVTGYLFSDQAANYHSLSAIVYSDEGNELVVRQDNYTLSGSLATATATMECDWNWTSFLNDIQGSTLTVEFKFDGTSLEIIYTLVPLMHGQVYEATSNTSLSDGTTYTATQTITIPETYTQKYVVTGLTSKTGVYPSFVLEESFFAIKSVENGTLGAVESLE